MSLPDPTLKHEALWTLYYAWLTSPLSHDPAWRYVWLKLRVWMNGEDPPDPPPDPVPPDDGARPVPPPPPPPQPAHPDLVPGIISQVMAADPTNQGSYVLVFGDVQRWQRFGPFAPTP